MPNLLRLLLVILFAGILFLKPSAVHAQQFRVQGPPVPIENININMPSHDARKVIDWMHQMSPTELSGVIKENKMNMGFSDFAETVIIQDAAKFSPEVLHTVYEVTGNPTAEMFFGIYRNGPDNPDIGAGLTFATAYGLSHPQVPEEGPEWKAYQGPTNQTSFNKPSTISNTDIIRKIATSAPVKEGVKTLGTSPLEQWVNSLFQSPSGQSNSSNSPSFTFNPDPNSYVYSPDYGFVPNLPGPYDTGSGVQFFQKTGESTFVPYDPYAAAGSDPYAYAGPAFSGIASYDIDLAKTQAAIRAGLTKAEVDNLPTNFSGSPEDISDQIKQAANQAAADAFARQAADSAAALAGQEVLLAGAVPGSDLPASPEQIAAAQAALQSGLAGQTSGLGGGTNFNPVNPVPGVNQTNDNKYNGIERGVGAQYAGDPCSNCSVDKDGNLFVTTADGEKIKITGGYNEKVNPDDPNSPTFGDLQHQQPKDPAQPDPGDVPDPAGDGERRDGPVAE